MDRVFLDANVLFSAAYRPDAKLLVLWELEDVDRISSTYAVAEARRNLADAAQLARLDRLLTGVHIITGTQPRALLDGVDLPAKDWPMLLAAIAAGATHLLTADKRHFGPLYGQVMQGVMVLPPSVYLRARLG